MTQCVTISGTPRPRLYDILCSWEGTPRVSGQCAKRGGSDCAGFVLGVMGELAGEAPLDIPMASLLKERVSVEKIVRAYLKHFPSELVRGLGAEPGDILAVGPKNEGVTHAMIVGNTYLWHCVAGGVCRTGFALHPAFEFKRIIRNKNKGNW